MKWQSIAFRDFVDFQPETQLQKGELYPFISMDVLEPYFRSVQPLEERFWDGGGGAKFQNGDTLFARITPCLEHGKTALIRNLQKIKGFGSTEFFVFRSRPNVSDKSFIYYLCCSDIIRQPAIKSMIGASGRQRAQRIVLENLLINVPKRIEDQIAIASILSSYDDLIENNRKRIVLLEESARELYKEWFVRLRFPGFEHTKIVKGVPEGWQQRTVGELAKVKSGFAFKSQDWQPEGNPVIKIKNIGDGTIDIVHCDCVPDRVIDKAQRFLLHPGNLLIAMTGATIGKVGLMPPTERKYYLNQRVGIFTSQMQYNPIWFLYVFFCSDYAKSILSG